MANANDRRAVQQAATLEKAARKAELEAVRYLMREPIGRRLAQRLLDQTGVDRATPFQPNAMILSHDIGLQALGHFLLSEIRIACPEQELVMRRETHQLAQRADLAEDFEHEQRDSD